MTTEAMTVVSEAIPAGTSGEVLDAQVVAMFPPRPEAIMTFLHDDDYLPGVQTLLYSLKKTLSLNQTYPPEIVVLVTPNISAKVQETLYPAFCTRIVQVEEFKAPDKSINDKLAKGSNGYTRKFDNHCPGWTKLQIFALQQYETIVYVDADCLVLKDIAHLFDLNKVYTESEALIAAAPDILPPHCFNSGVMVIRPSKTVFETMERHATLLTTYDGSDTGFLNAYFNTWFTDFPGQARLPVGYNAQQPMFDMTSTRQEQGGDGSSTTSSSFWDVQITADLHIVHYSNPVKPWEETGTTSSLQLLWKNWYQKSKNFLTRYRKERAKEQELEREALAQQERKRKQEQQQQRMASSAGGGGGGGGNSASLSTHKQISKRYKQLRAQGMSTQDAMQHARAEIVPDEDKQSADVGSQVAAMFGMR